MPMLPQEVQALFTGADGHYRFARWSRPLAPVIFGVESPSLCALKSGIEAIASLTGLGLTDVDPETGANLMVFFLRDWAELADAPALEGLVPGLPSLAERLEARGANQYRLFRFDADGSIRAAFVFLRMDAALAALPAEDLALDQAVRIILLWAEGTFRAQGPLARYQGVAVLRPDLAALIRAAYSPVLPACTQDATHALRLAART